MSNELTAVIGGLITFLLSVNAYYFKDIVKTLTEIKVSLMQLSTEHINNVNLVNKHETEIDRLRERVHKIEGQSSQVLAYFQNAKN